MKYLNVLIVTFSMMHAIYSQKATVREENLNMKTYMFGDPDPVPNINRIYPYFRFDGYTDQGEYRDWKMVVLENDYIKVYVSPEVGGKIWGAIEKSTGNEFMYFNEVVKFRDVAMRGAWTSGGLEYNFGDIGHIPTCATPVDYALKEYPDGSVACVVGALDLPSRTKWNVEIRLHPDKAYFETIATWENSSEVPVTYYHWMNAAAKADGDLEFIYPGNKRIGHGGELGEWPMDSGRDISRYENNDFGIYKSYHIIDSYSDYFGGYWQEDDFGFGHYADYVDKPGKKIWIWGLSDQGMIWEELLTDSNGQYIEYQAGKLFNQSANSSTFTPFKHREFMPHDVEVAKELWFPLKGTKGMVAASEYGVLNVKRKGSSLEIRLSALQPLDTYMEVRTGTRTHFRRDLELSTLELYTDTLNIEGDQEIQVMVGDHLLVYNSDAASAILDRPYEPGTAFDWESAYGLYVKGLELEKQRRYTEAHETYLKSFETEATHVPTLNRLGLSYYRMENWEKALEFSKKALAIDTYNGLANYIYGLANTSLGNPADAKSGFSIASQSVGMRTASYTELAKLFMKEGLYAKALEYTDKALTYNAYAISAMELRAILLRKMDHVKEGERVLVEIYEQDATNLIHAFENYFLGTLTQKEIQAKITNELAYESYLEVALQYMAYGAEKEALQILKMSPTHPIVALIMAHLGQGDRKKLLEEVMAMDAEMVFPHRTETSKVLREFIKKNDHWKFKYYLAIQQWSKGNLEEAKKLFLQCGNEPDFVPFYLAKIKLFPGSAETRLEALERAVDIDNKNWRVQLALIEHYMETNQWKAAKKLTKKALSKNPEKAVLGMRYAKILLQLKEYKEGLHFLETFNVLPFEGATEGRTVYHETCVRLAIQALLAKDYDEAIFYAKKAKLWPKNLGVGKHYDVDERLDNYLLALAYNKKGEPEEAEKYFDRIMSHQTPDYLNESSKLYFQLVVLEKFNREDQIQELLQKISKELSDNQYLEWAVAKYKESDHEGVKKAISSLDEKVHAYDTKFIDEEFKLVLDIVDTLVNFK
ncbi:DUF5107 domain-containing protein [Antarcticibacterium sp. 1MA-6-2]|uniref:DUF5107 domain-containing protein n=1 Tax=Antarcticibacterium sp. 1MA-6-2 TaxID=2908210 RepID=UPI001F37BBA0|nr:DUF5107 domain-containing protein [Antarcticibacterium sp. 1MA-6-2]UJH92687.1 DUF5107 domain-containing protein [Antarcticibacterium sp. 1MA-6-2]